MMFLTVTLNTGIDRVLLIDELQIGQPVRGAHQVDCVGGKGLDVSVALRGLGQPTVGLSILGGQNGRLLEGMLTHYGIVPEIIWAAGENRVCYVIAERKHKRVSHIMTGELEVGLAELEAVKARFQSLIPQARWAVLAGSLPQGVQPGIYAELTRLAHQGGAPVLIDGLGEAILEATPAQPEILKMNRDEFNATFGKTAENLSLLLPLARAIQAEYRLPALVITCGTEGLVGLCGQEVYIIRPPTQEAVNAAGAGDAASAGLIWRRTLGESWEEALRWAGAVSAAAVLTEATGEVRLADAERILPKVQVERIG